MIRRPMLVVGALALLIAASVDASLTYDPLIPANDPETNSKGLACPSACCSPWSNGDCVDDCVDGVKLWFKEEVVTYKPLACPADKVCCKKEQKEAAPETPATMESYISRVYAKQVSGGVVYITDREDTVSSLNDRFGLEDHVLLQGVQPGAEIALGKDFDITTVGEETSISAIKSSLGWPSAWNEDTRKIIQYNCLCGRDAEKYCLSSCAAGTFSLHPGWVLIIPAKSETKVPAKGKGGVKNLPTDPKNPIERKEIRRVDTDQHKERCTESQKQKCKSPCIECMTLAEVRALSSNNICEDFKQGEPERSQLGTNRIGMFPSFMGELDTTYEWHNDEANQWITGKLGDFEIEKLDDKTSKRSIGGHDVRPNKFLLHTIQGTWPYAGDWEAGISALNSKKAWPHFIVARDRDCKLRIGQFLPLGKRGQSLRGNNNRYGAIQVEIGTQAGNEFTSYDRGIANVVMALWYRLNVVSKGHIPIWADPKVKFVDYATGSGPHRWKPDASDVPARLSVDDFKAVRGLVGHQHSPGTFSMTAYNQARSKLGGCNGKKALQCRAAALVGDDHSDPGAINPYAMMNGFAAVYDWFKQ